MNQIDKAGRKLLKERFNSSFLKRYYGEGYGDLRKRKIASKKSSKQIIESDTDPSTESLYVQYPGEEAVNVSGLRGEGAVAPDRTKLSEFLKRGRGRNYREVHTHPYDPKEDRFHPFLPSSNDLETFFKKRKRNFSAIAQRDKETGEVRGYVCLLKKNKSDKTLPKERLTPNEKNIIMDFRLSEEQNHLLKDPERYCREKLENLRRGVYSKNSDGETQYSEGILKYRLVPAKGYRWDADKIQFVKKEGLENKIAAGVIAVSFISSLFFLSSNFTGYSIVNFSMRESNFMSIRLFFIGLIFTYFLIKNKRYKK